MTINYTTLLGLAKPVTGTESGVWGDVVNDQITSLLEDAIANAASISVTAGNVTLTDNNGSSDQSRMAILLVTGSPGVSRNIVAPSTSKWYIVKNSSNAEIVLKGSATTGVTIPAGAEAFAFWNGSDFELAAMIGPSSSTDNAVARFDGTTGKVVQNSAVTIADTTGDITTGGYVFTAAGAAGTPAYSTSGDANTGMWFPAADTIAFSEGGTEAMRLDSSGNVGIGTNNPTTRLQISSTTGTAADFAGSLRITNQSFTSGTYAGVLFETADTLNSYVTGIRQASFAGALAFGVNVGTNGTSLQEGMRLNSSGNLGIGTSSPGAKLDVSGSVNAVQARFGNVAGRGLEIGTSIISGTNDAGSVLNAKGATSGTMIFQTDSTERVRITNGGDVGIGTSSPASRLHVTGSGSAIEANTGYGRFNLRNVSTTGQEFHIRPDSGKNGYITFTENDVADRWVIGIENGNGAFLFKTGSATSNTERARITNGGDLLVNTTSSRGRITAETSSASGNFGSNNTAGSGTRYHVVFYESAVERGSITSNGSVVAYNTSSDQRLKENISPAEDAASIVDAIQVRQFDWKDSQTHQRYGFVAQELEPIFAEAVTKPDDPERMMSVDYAKLVPVLVKEIQSLRARVAALESKGA